jgi:DNA-binding NarL/FixJ family response regulator
MELRAAEDRINQLEAEVELFRERHPATTFVVIANESDEEESLNALNAGASAILPRSAESTEIATAIDSKACLRTSSIPACRSNRAGMLAGRDPTASLGM